jgi:two-component system, LuxR family, sensor kinase FixL
MSRERVQDFSTTVDVSAATALTDFEAGKKLLDAFEQSRAAGVDAMGAALAHELNQPLAALTLYLQSLQRLCGRLQTVDPLMRELVDKSFREAERAGEIVRRMRRFSARSEPDRQTIDMAALAEESIEISTVGLSRRVDIKRSYEPGLPMVSIDPVQIRQVMVNLLKNAIDAVSRKAKPNITVTTESRGGNILFSVADNGPGIDPKMADRLFRAFETSKPQGMGLGLAISRMIAQNHGGDLVLEPGGIGGGACFGLRLPKR